jgi:hypothetical protein
MRNREPADAVASADNAVCVEKAVNVGRADVDDLKRPGAEDGGEEAKT